MARAAYNTTGECRFGPGTGTPGDLKFTVDCRYVPQLEITITSDAMSDCDAYVTYTGGLTVAGTRTDGAGIVTLDYNEADRWDFPLLGIFYQTVYWTDRVATVTRPAYRRAHVGPSLT